MPIFGLVSRVQLDDEVNQEYALYGIVRGRLSWQWETDEVPSNQCTNKWLTGLEAQFGFILEHRSLSTLFSISCCRNLCKSERVFHCLWWNRAMLNEPLCSFGDSGSDLSTRVCRDLIWRRADGNFLMQYLWLLQIQINSSRVKGSVLFLHYKVELQGKELILHHLFSVVLVSQLWNNLYVQGHEPPSDL